MACPLPAGPQTTWKARLRLIKPVRAPGETEASCSAIRAVWAKPSALGHIDRWHGCGWTRHETNFMLAARRQHNHKPQIESLGHASKKDCNCSRYMNSLTWGHSGAPVRVVRRYRPRPYRLGGRRHRPGAFGERHWKNRRSQAFKRALFLRQAPADVLPVVFGELGLQQSSVSVDGIPMCAHASQIVFRHGRHPSNARR